MKKIVLAIISLVSINSAYALDNIETLKKNDYENYCKYVTQRAQAKSVKLNAPDILAKVSKSEGDDKFIALGVTKNLQDFSKSELVLEIAQNDCALYKTTLETSENIKYVTATLEKNALLYKMSLYRKAKDELQTLVNKIKKQVDSQNETIMTLYSIEANAQKIETNEQQMQLQLAQLQVPYVEITPLNEILERLKTIEMQENAKQRNISKLEKKDNWDVNVLAGVKHGILSPDNKAGVFFGISANYNFAGNKSNAILDNSDIAYNEWKKNQKNGLNSAINELKQKLIDIKTVEKDNYNKLLEHKERLNKLLTKVSSINTSEAIKFKTQLQANKIIQDIDIDASKYKIDLLENYLK